MSKDRQLRAVHLILDFEPISRVFQEIGHTIRAGDPRINCINVSKPNFLAREVLPPVRLPVKQIPPPLIIPLQQVPLEALVAAEEEIASSRLSLEEEIDQFRFVEDMRPSEKPVDISDSETESVNRSSIHPKQLIITQVDSEFEVEEEQIDQKKRPSLKGLLASRNKGGNSKVAPKTQPLAIPAPPPPTDLGLLTMPNLKKRRPDQELEEGELVPWKENKQQKMTKDPRDKRGNSVDSKGEIEVRRPQRLWAPRLEMDGAVIPYNASIWDAPRGHANYLAQALQQPFFLTRDMNSIRHTKQPNLFMSLKRDLVMVSCFSTIQVFKIRFFFFLNKSVMLIAFLIILVISMQVTQQVYVAED